MQSMTGFGRSVATASIGTLTTEIRSVNHRYCQVSLRLPSEFSEFEARLVTLIKQWATRGQISAALSFSPEIGAATPRVRLNSSLASAIMSEASRLQSELGVEQPLSMGDVLKLPQVLVTEAAELDAQARWDVLERGVSEAWEALAKMREREGAALQASMCDGLARVRALSQEIAADVPDLICHYRERLEARIRDLTRNGQDVDEARIVMEAGILADRADITEELDRIRSHCDQMESSMASGEPAGRQMDFILQELNRESNTIASKAANTAIISRSVALKTEIERLREQCQNVE
jgi:uncharacterized protein (TIGR00255 family)